MRRLAVGGMAEIYLARVTGAAGFEKLVVLKRVLPNVAEDPTFVQMFLDEAKLAATLRHPNIADVYDVGESDGTFFFTMEYVYGQDVRSIRHEAKKREERIPLAQALAIVHGVASALDHAHEKLGADGKPLGLVHRDVSASNVMVSYDGAVKLLDFGIARAASSTHKTQTGTLKGKVPYMSPEQCKGLPLDRRSDLFSLGTVLYELTVGRRPFRGETDFAIMDQIVYQGTKPPSQVVSGYPPELEAIVMKLLERAPSMRYPTGEDLLHDLDEFVAKHGLWLSPRAIGKYMRTLFADRMQAWEQAEQEGVPFVQYVATSITSQSQRSELLTPPSEFPGVMPPRTTSEQMAVVQAPLGKRTSAPMPAMQPLQAVTPKPLPAQTYIPESQPFERPSAVEVPIYPSIRPRTGKTIFLAFAGTMVLAAGGVVGFMVSRGDKAATVEKQEPAKQMLETADTPAPGPAKPAATETAKPAPAGAETAKPAGAETTEAAKPLAHVAPRTPTVPVVDTNPTVPTETKTVTSADKPAPEKATEVRTVEPKKPTIVKRPPPRKAEPKQPPPVVKKPDPQPKSEPKKEQTWDPNSPFLPQ
jgi:serine/threonine protein kinase